MTVAYSTSNASKTYNKLSVTVNGEAIATDFAGTTYIEYPVEVQAGDTVTVEAEHTVLSSSTSTAYTGRVRLTSTGQITIEADIEDAPKRVFSQYTEGTGAIGGWGESELRQYYKNTLKPLMPENVRAGVKTVLKSQPAYQNNGTTSGSSFTQTTEDDLWAPSYNEMFGSSSTTNQPRYKAIYPDNESRKKSKVGATSAIVWWLRSASYTNLFHYVDSSGSDSYSGAYSSYGIPLGFST